MNLRQALTELGPERVRMGMRAFEDPLAWYDWGRCFLARAYGEPMMLFKAATAWWRRWLWKGTLNDRVVRLLDISPTALRMIVYEFDRWDPVEGPGVRLRREAIAYLAEHGTIIEPGLNVPVGIQSL